MNMRIIAVLFTVVFAIGVTPLVLAQPSASASAWLTSGFMLPIAIPAHAFVFMLIGVLSGWMGLIAMTLLPVCAILMLTIGVLMQVDTHQLPLTTDFVIGSILLFAYSVSLLRNKAFLLGVVPISLWTYFTGGNYMLGIPTQASLYLLQGILVSAALIMGIGVCIGVTLADNTRHLPRRFRHWSRLTSFLSFFSLQ